MSDGEFGIRLRRWRLRRGLSQRALAELAGFTQGYVGQIENGLVTPDKLSTRMALAEALQISVTELAGPREAADRNGPAGIESSLDALRHSLAVLSMPSLRDGQARNTRPVIDFPAMSTYFNECRYDRLVPAIADAIIELAYASDTAAPEEHLAYQRQLVDLCHSAATSCVTLNRRDLALVAAEHCRRLATELAEPAQLGIAGHATLKSLFDTPGIEQVAQRGIALLGPHVGRDPLTAEAYGMHHLMSAALAAVKHDRSGALDHLAEARRVAQHTGERPRDRFVFGPANVAIWRLSIMSTLGEGPAALDPCGDADPYAVRSASRLVFYHVHRATALLQARGREREAVWALLQAESLGPQLVRLIPDTRAAVRSLLRRARATSGGDLRGLVDRIGFAD
jgi:transcriptional regulator with XRE-family HTH domain